MTDHDCIGKPLILDDHNPPTVTCNVVGCDVSDPPKYRGPFQVAISRGWWRPKRIVSIDVMTLEIPLCTQHRRGLDGWVFKEEDTE